MGERKRAGTPGETDLRSPVVVTGVVEITADADEGPGEGSTCRAEFSDIKIAVLFVNRAEVLVAKAEVEREVGMKFEVILNIAGIGVGTNVMTGLRQSAGERIEVSVLLNGRVVGEIPKILEKVLRQSAASADVGILIAVEVKTEFQGVATHDFGQTVMEVVGGFVEDAGTVGSEDESKAADVVSEMVVDDVLRKTEWLLRITL